MNLRALAAIFLLLTAGCAASPGGPPDRLSGMISPDPAPAGTEGPLIGVIADSQLQTRGNYHNVFGYRGRFADRVVWVSMRPPAVDWAARAMLLARLDELRAKDVKAIFYLGDGANNGCQDEFSAGFGSAAGLARPNEEGLLAILDDFRRSSGIPIYFVLGNHDLLGAGSTGKAKERRQFCEERRPGFSNRWLTKFEVIELAEQFNRGNAPHKEWSYNSSFAGERTKNLCGAREAQQHRRGGCYLAATVNYRGPSADAEFLLLDTNDWAHVSRSLLLWLQQEGIRGAMSFGELKNGAESQTRWFERNTQGGASMRIAMTHYNVNNLQKRVPVVGLVSRKSQQFMNLFTDPLSRASKQDGAYVISAHTHTPRPEVHERRFRIGCAAGARDCKPSRLSVAELNVGSTSDYSNYAAVVKLAPSAGSKGALHFTPMQPKRERCFAIWQDIEGHSFPKNVPIRGGLSNRGWAAIGADRPNRHAYRGFGWDDAQAVWANLDSYMKLRKERIYAECVGLYAAATEYGVDPVTGDRFASAPRGSHKASGADRYP